MMGHRIYAASKTRHADMWKHLRDDCGVPIISTWIDEAGPGESTDLSDLWERCVEEASNATSLILYAEAEDVLKGALVELGAALAHDVRVLIVCPNGCASIGSFKNHPWVTEHDSVWEALQQIGVGIAPAARPE